MNVGDVRQFDWIGPLYDRFTPGMDESTLERGLALAERPIERVLDVGGGTGRAARSIPADRRIVADAAPGMLDQARKHDLEPVRADGATLPVRNDSVDLVTIVDALHHIADPGGTLTEAHRVLRPGGALVVADFDPTTIRGRLLVSFEHLIGFDSMFRPPKSLRAAMTQIGFEPTITMYGFDYTVVGVKAQRG